MMTSPEKIEYVKNLKTIKTIELTKFVQKAVGFCSGNFVNIKLIQSSSIIMKVSNILEIILKLTNLSRAEPRQAKSKAISLG